MKVVPYVMASILSCLIITEGTAIASPIEIRFADAPPVFGPGAQKNGGIKLEFESESGGGTVLVGLEKNNIKEGDKSKDILDSLKTVVENIVGAEFTATRKTESSSGVPAPPGFTNEHLVITPKPGTPDFKSIKMSDNSAGIPNFSIRVLSTDKGKSTLSFQGAGALATADGVTDWHLSVLTQDLQVLGAAFLELPNMTESSQLLDDFAIQLLGENIPVSIMDNALTMTSLQNNFFSISYDGNPKFHPLLSNQVPEPKIIFLFLIGLMALILAHNLSLQPTAFRCAPSVG